MPIEEVVKLLSKLKPASEGSLMFEEERVILTTATFLVDALKMLPEERFGKIVETIYHKAFVKYGRWLAEEKEFLGPRGVVEDLLRLFAAYGWGKTELVSFNEETLSVSFRVYASIYGERYRKLSEYKDEAFTPQCPMGYAVEGALSFFAQKKGVPPPVSEEVKCIARGDPYCEFVIIT